jgi:hypothetical protein
MGPKTVPPWRHWGARVLPWRARPVPFCFQGLRPPPETAPRVLCARVPARSLAALMLETSCSSAWLMRPPKRPTGNSTSPTFSFFALYSSVFAMSSLLER